MNTLVMRMVAAFFCGVVFLATAASTQSGKSRQTNLRALVDAEAAFAQAAATKGTRQAFLEFLDDDGVIFQPDPVNGKDFWRQREPRKGLLSWHPTYVDVSAAGDLGYTTGPFEFRPNYINDKPIAFGQYFTIWKKKKDGSWKAVLDRGISYPHAAPTSENLKFASAASVKTTKGVTGAQARAPILKAEGDFQLMAARHGLRKAVDAFFASDVHVLRENSFPQFGKAVGAELAVGSLTNMTWRPVMADLSESGDLGYSYGEYEAEVVSTAASQVSTAAPQKGVFVRMWKRQSTGDFKVVVDIQVPRASQ